MIFVDTSAWVALTDAKDRFYQRATGWFKAQTTLDFVTSNVVIVETLGWLRYNCGSRVAIETGKRLYLGKELQIEKVTSEIEQEAWLLFQKLEGRGISMIDCTSFVLMKRFKIKKVFAFDTDFAKQGFTVHPS